MIVTIMLVYAGFFQGMMIPWYAFVGAAIFDWQMAEYVFPQQGCDECDDSGVKVEAK